MRAWSIVCSSLHSQDVALPPNLPFWGELLLPSLFFSPLRRDSPSEWVVEAIIVIKAWSKSSLIRFSTTHKGPPSPSTRCSKRTTNRNYIVEIVLTSTTTTLNLRSQRIRLPNNVFTDCVLTLFKKPTVQSLSLCVSCAKMKYQRQMNIAYFHCDWLVG